MRLEPNIKVFGLFDLREPEIAIAVLDTNTLAIGKPSTVRTAIDADSSGKRVDAELVQLATREANAVMGFAGTVPGIVARRIDLGSDQLSRPFRAVRGFYGALLTTASGFEFLTNLRTTDQTAAGELCKTLLALRDFIPGLLTQLPAAIGKAAAANARNIRINAQDAEVAIRVEIVPPGTVALIRRSLTTKLGVTQLKHR